MDKEKVKKSLKTCSSLFCGDCRYFGEDECFCMLCKDTLKFIDEQEKEIKLYKQKCLYEEKYESSRFIEIEDINIKHILINTKYIVNVLDLAPITEIFLADDCGIVCTYESYENVVNKIKGDRK